MRYVVMASNTDGGRSATVHSSFEEAIAAVRAYLSDPDNQPPQGDEERAEMERDIRDATPEYVCSVRGSDAWKEWVYIAPLDE